MARRRRTKDRTGIEGEKMKGHEQLYRVEIPYFVCGLVTVNGWVVEAAPVMHWAKGKSVESVERWIKSKGGALTLLE